MSKTLLTYDLQERLNESTHSDVKKAMKELGYVDRVEGINGTIYLPNTTLVHPTVTTVQARDQIVSIASQCGTKATRVFAVNYDDPASAIIGEAYAS